MATYTLDYSGQQVDKAIAKQFVYTDGFLIRPTFSKYSSSQLRIGQGGRYHHEGTAENIGYWNSNLVINLTLTGTQFYYLYIDDDAIYPDNNLDTAGFVHSTTAPTWSATKNAYYNGDDRCIFAFRSESGSLQDFYHDGGRLVHMPRENELTSTNVGTTADTVDITVPSFCTEAFLDIDFLYNSGGTSQIRTRVTGDTSSVAILNNTDVGTVFHYDRWLGAHPLSSSQQIDVIQTNNEANLTNIRTIGWYLPQGL